MTIQKMDQSAHLGLQIAICPKGAVETSLGQAEP